MYRCKDCGKEYKEKIDYCDCGNNTFDYTEDFIPVEKPQKHPQLSPAQKAELISRIFFAICLILSVIVWLIPVKVEQKAKEEIAEIKSDTKLIPNIESIWNGTPPKIEVKAEEKPQTLLDTLREEIPD